MSRVIRPFTPDDYPAVNAIDNAAYPEYPRSVEELRFQDEHHDPKCRFQRWVAEREGQVVAFGEYDQNARTYHPRKFLVYVAAQPDHQRQGIGSALYDHVIAALQPFDPLAVRSHAREDMAHSLRFLKRREFHDIKSNNRPMLSINEALGFVKQPAWIIFVKELGREGE